MVASPLIDAVLSSAQSRKRWPKVAAQLVQSAISDLRQIEKLDSSLSPEDPLEFDRQTADVIRSMYEKWAQETESLIERIDRLEKQSAPVADSEALRDAYGRTRARLSISLDQIERGLRDVAEGRTTPIAEVRRELHLRAK